MKKRYYALAAVVVLATGGWFAYNALNVSALFGIHVCTAAHFDKASVLCRQDDSRIADLTTARLQLAAPGGTFRASTLTILISTPGANGGTTPLGAYHDDHVNRADGLRAYRLDPVFRDAGIVPEAGRTYHLEVDDREGSLGSATFMYTGA